MTDTPFTPDLTTTPPTSPEREWPPRLWTPLSGWLMVAVYIVAFVLVSTVQFLIIADASGGMEALSQGGEMVIPFSASLVTFFGFALFTLGGFALVGMGLRRHNLFALGFRPTTQRWIWLSIGIGVAIAVSRFVLAGGLVLLFPALGEGTEGLAGMLLPEGQPLLLVASLLLAGVLVPFYEEVFFRGFFHNWLRNRLGMWTAIILSSLAFGLIHIIPLQVFMAFLLGIVCAWAYEKSGSIWPAILVHMVNNLLAIGVAIGFTLLGVSV